MMSHWCAYLLVCRLESHNLDWCWLTEYTAVSCAFCSNSLCCCCCKPTTHCNESHNPVDQLEKFCFCHHNLNQLYSTWQINSITVQSIRFTDKPVLVAESWHDVHYFVVTTANGFGCICGMMHYVLLCIMNEFGDSFLARFSSVYWI